MQTDSIMVVQMEEGDYLLHEGEGREVISITEDWENPDLFHIEVRDDDGYAVPVRKAPFDIVEIVTNFDDEDEAPEE